MSKYRVGETIKVWADKFGLGWFSTPRTNFRTFSHIELEQTILTATLMLYSSRLVARPVKTDVHKYISEWRWSRKLSAQNVVCGSKRAYQLLKHSTQDDKPGHLD